MPLDQTEAINQLKAELGQATYTATTTPIKGRLMTANGTATTAGTEVTNAGGSTYAAQSVGPSLDVAAASGLIAQTQNNAAVTFNNMPAATIVGIELWDSNATPKRKRYGPLTTSKVCALGDSVSFAANALVLTQS